MLAANRNVLAAIANIGRCKIYIGQLDDGVALEEQAIRLSPHDPFLGVWYFRIGQARLLQSRVDEAISWLEKAHNQNATYPFVPTWLAAAYGLKGDLPRAAAELADARKLAGNGAPANIAAARAISAGILPQRGLKHCWKPPISRACTGLGCRGTEVTIAQTGKEIFAADERG